MAAMPRQSIDMHLRWGDMDAFGHINNVEYLRLIEEARVRLFTTRGTEGNGTLMDTGVLVARAEIDYLRPMVYRSEPIVIDIWVTKIGGSSFDLQYAVQDGPDRAEQVVYVVSESTLVLFDLERGRPRRLRDSEREALEAWRDEPIRLRGHKRFGPKTASTS